MPKPDYALLLTELQALLSVENDPIANAANVSAFVYENIPELNWVGFYFLKIFQNDKQLVVGPFQGKPACTRIGMGRGVCGKAFNDRIILNVPDVHAFSDHIVCDNNSASELVVPLFKNDQGIGVFDIDSPIKNRFDQSLEMFLESVAEIYLAATDFSEAKLRSS